MENFKLIFLRNDGAAFQGSGVIQLTSYKIYFEEECVDVLNIFSYF